MRWPKQSPRTRGQSWNRCTGSRRCHGSAEKGTPRRSIASRLTSGTCAWKRTASDATCWSAPAASSSPAAACRSSTGATPPCRACFTATRKGTPTRSASGIGWWKGRCWRAARSPSSTASAPGLLAAGDLLARPAHGGLARGRGPAGSAADRPGRFGRRAGPRVSLRHGARRPRCAAHQRHARQARPRRERRPPARSTPSRPSPPSSTRASSS